MNENKFFIEIDSAQASEHGQHVLGDVYLHKKSAGRIVAVLSDGAGSGVKANVIASVISSMALHYILSDESPLRAAKAVIETFARGEHIDDTRQATFTIMDIDEKGAVKVIEFENPSTLFFRQNKRFYPPKVVHELTLNSAHQLYVTTYEFNAEVEDRIMIYSDGVTMSGTATRRLPDGWGTIGMEQGILSMLEETPGLSASELCRKVISAAEMNDLFVVKNDMSCASVYFRNPRSILICTGAPFDAEKDKYLAKLVAEYNGEIIISGGTTSQIIARELGREINVVLKRDPSGLPPVSTMEGATLVTEGVLTLGKVKLMLETLKNTHVKGRGTDTKIVSMLLEHDIVEFVVGTRINAVHQDPTLPMELELRRNVVKDIARILEQKFMKEVRINYV